MAKATKGSRRAKGTKRNQGISGIRVGHSFVRKLDQDNLNFLPTYVPSRIFLSSCFTLQRAT